MTEPVVLTPAMKQYLDIKSQHQDAILLFRMGDFYEMFFEDAQTASRELDLTLTSRNKGKEDAIPLCGFPYHAASSYISKLINKGYRVAICEQMEDPKLAKGVVKRDVVRIVTPGLVVDDSNLNPKENNFLASAYWAEQCYGTAFVDLSTGEFRVGASGDWESFLSTLTTFRFRELLLAENMPEKNRLAEALGEMHSYRCNEFPETYFDTSGAADLLREQFEAGLVQRLNIADKPAVLGAAGAALRYIKETQKGQISHLNKIEWYHSDVYLLIDEAARRNLEIFSTMAENTARGSLFHVIDETMTSMGGRKLRWWLNYPLISPEPIKERLLAVHQLKEEHLLRQNLRKVLGRIYDLERLGSRVVMGIANARDLIGLNHSLKVIPEVKSLIASMDTPLIHEIYDELDEMADLCDLLQKSIHDDPPLTLREGGIIKEGYDEELDRYLSLSKNAKQWIAALEEKERKRTGINSLKVGFNSVFGYYIEITRANSDLVPPDYIRKQTLVNAERYINEELKKYEYEVLNAEESRREREYTLFVQVRERIATEIRRLQQSASRIAELDALTSLAEVAERYNYCCPVVDDGDLIRIRDGRHPVIERMPLPEGFVPNDLVLDLEDNRLLIITGPNMAGKSTYIRQIALIILMAQIGSFVPAVEAHIGVVDKIFARIGAADNLSRGQSTFMVEMTEMSNILRNMTGKSLVILDEVGRGTSTFDGLSIAWAVAEYLHDFKGSGVRTMFATHYHQLTELSVTRRGVRNYNIAVKEWGNRIIFLRKIIEGGTNRSYGIQVARIAGVDDAVIDRAGEILNNLETAELDVTGKPRFAREKTAGPPVGQLSLFADERELLIEELQSLDIANLTPLEALVWVGKWRDKLKQPI
ncbi:MAG: DNA mismatch repair protein MutS [Deltaproteobacteria bacterium]|nr:DNA mismatch repair protein MutS [Deltaproteobacteria bacterium]